MPSEYRSSIPRSAAEVVVSERRRERFGQGSEVLVGETECRYRGKVVGRRSYEDGTLLHETPFKNGKKHGIEYWWWNKSDALCSAEPYHEGVPHGTARQWTFDGRLLGTYTMVHGTGLDVWRDEADDGTILVSELWEYRDGRLHGFNWWLNQDQASVYIEQHFQNGRPHGIHREWNNAGRLKRGHPQYFVEGERVTKRQYLRASASDPTLPPFRGEDTLPAREFPAAIRKEAGLNRRRG